MYTMGTFFDGPRASFGGALKKTRGNFHNFFYQLGVSSSSVRVSLKLGGLTCGKGSANETLLFKVSQCKAKKHCPKKSKRNPGFPTLGRDTSP